MEKLSIDLMSPNPRSKRGNVFICTVVDVFFKWLEIFAIRNKETLTVARVLVEKVFCRLGTPLSILSDRMARLFVRFASCYTSTSCAQVLTIQPAMLRLRDSIVL